MNNGFELGCWGWTVCSRNIPHGQYLPLWILWAFCSQMGVCFLTGSWLLFTFQPKFSCIAPQTTRAIFRTFLKASLTRLFSRVHITRDSFHILSQKKSHLCTVIFWLLLAHYAHTNLTEEGDWKRIPLSPSLSSSFFTFFFFCWLLATRDCRNAEICWTENLIIRHVLPIGCTSQAASTCHAQLPQWPSYCFPSNHAVPGVSLKVLYSCYRNPRAFLIRVRLSCSWW